MPVPAPIDSLSRRVNAAPRRRGVRGLVQRIAVAVLPRGRRSAPLPLLDAPGADADAARARARRALVEARQAMSGVIGEGSSMAEETAIVPAVVPDLERLQAFLEESERDRAALREEVTGLRGLLEHVSAQLEALRLSIESIPRAPAPDETPPADDTPAGTPTVTEEPSASAAAPEPPTEEAAAAAPTPPDPAAEAPPAAEPASPPDAAAGAAADAAAPEEAAVPAEEITVLRERVLRALRERVFAAGTVGTKIEIRPPLPESETADVLARMNEQVLVERAEPGLPAEDATSLRVTLRAPMRWEQFSALLEAALGRPLPTGSVGWSHGVVRVDAAEAAPDHPPDQAAG